MADLSPDCLAALRAEYERSGSLAQTAARLRKPDGSGAYSKAAVSQLLSGTYRAADVSAIETSVRANLMNASVDCPATGGALPLARCHEISARPLSTASQESVRLYRACQTCPNNRRIER